MNLLNEDQKNFSISFLEAFIKGGDMVHRKEGSLPRVEFQNLRRNVIIELRVYINDFLNGNIGLDTFKTKIDSINKRNNHWGFTAIKGQMFFNQLVRVASDKENLVVQLKKSISLPRDLEDAKSKINYFSDYVTKLGEDIKDRRTVPNINSILYFLSYFWQIQEYEKYPVFYHSTDTVFKKLSLMGDDFLNLGEKYVFFTALLNELREIFERHAHRTFSFWDVEHVFWYFYTQNLITHETSDVRQKNPIKNSQKYLIDDDYIPPVVKDIPQLALDTIETVQKYGKIGKRVEDVFEDKLHKLFVMLGYEVEKLGKGKGRVPDGIALARQDQYAVIYDAKSRREPYNIGTDSRAIIEYINTYSSQLHRQGIKNIYFAIISSGFKDGQDDAVKNIKMETGVQELLFLPANLLLNILELKLKSSEIGIDRNGIQQIFQHHGLITKDEIQEILLGM